MLEDIVNGIKNEIGLRIAGAGSRRPRINIMETDNKLIIKVDLPGLDEKDILVETDEDSVSVSGERLEDITEEGEWLLKESSYGAFSRTIPLPAPVEVESASARFRNGELVLEITKKAESRRKKVKVE